MAHRRRHQMATTEMTQAASVAEGATAEGAADAVDEQLAARLGGQAKTEGVSLVGPDGLLHRVTKLVLEHALEGELTGHLGYQAGDPAGPTRSKHRTGRA